MICLKIKKETIIQSDDLEKIEKKEEERYFFENEKKWEKNKNKKRKKQKQICFLFFTILFNLQLSNYFVIYYLAKLTHFYHTLPSSSKNTFELFSLFYFLI